MLLRLRAGLVATIPPHLSSHPALRLATIPSGLRRNSLRFFVSKESTKVSIGTTKGRAIMARKKRSGPEEALDKTVGRLAEGAGSVTGDESLEAEGRTLRRKGERKTYVVTAHPNGGWQVRTEGASRASSVHRTKPEAVAAAKELARSKTPSQVLVYKKDGLEVQEEKTYG
jgi:uncharacterized protein YjbJ (UPF0337 family)